MSRSVAYEFGRKLAEASGEAVYPLLAQDPNAAMQGQRTWSTLNGMFNQDPPIDATSPMPDPGMIHRALG